MVLLPRHRNNPSQTPRPDLLITSNDTRKLFGTGLGGRGGFCLFAFELEVSECAATLARSLASLIIIIIKPTDVRTYRYPCRRPGQLRTRRQMYPSLLRVHVKTHVVRRYEYVKLTRASPKTTPNISQLRHPGTTPKTNTKFTETEQNSKHISAKTKIYVFLENLPF